MATVRALMTPAPHTIGSQQTIGEAARRMRDAHVRHLPVLTGGHLVGLVSERDARLVETLSKTETVLVGEVMSPEPYAVAPDDDLARVVEVMATRKLGSAVVLEDDRVIGIFTTTDALHLLLRHLSIDALRGF
jgi:acetoin utilization protein AcuB